MTAATYIRRSEGTPFEDGDDHGRIIISGQDTGGRYSIMEYAIAARPVALPDVEVVFGAHRHREIEETFFVRSGTLRFLLGNDVIDMSSGDLVRVPPGVRHGFANISGEPVDLLITFVPGGFEELFVRHRTDQSPPPGANDFVDVAVRDFASEFEE